MELWIRSIDCNVIGRFSTAQGVIAPTPALLKSQLFIYVYVYLMIKGDSLENLTAYPVM